MGEVYLTEIERELLMVFVNWKLRTKEDKFLTNEANIPILEGLIEKMKEAAKD